uniref:Secondary ossification center associated regulator of chondrocyte maturation n=1 Tax=Paramormyrops kingsleyae TaxID=1676925 RepID=A0A3B3RV69_9TELE
LLAVADCNYKSISWVLVLKVKIFKKSCADAPLPEAMADPSPQADNPEMSSGAQEGGMSLSSPRLAGVLGPGAISVIVIAVFLGTSALLALTVISLRKLAAS